MGADLMQMCFERAMAEQGFPTVRVCYIWVKSWLKSGSAQKTSLFSQVRAGGANVQQCWHGTAADALLSILKTGFTAGRTVNGKTFGQGLYMAPANQAATSM